MISRTSPRAGGGGGAGVVALLACLVIGACRGAEPPAPAAATPDPVPAALAVRLLAEAAARPEGTPRLEDLVASLRAAGVGIARTRQVLGASMGARFCAVARTGSGHTLAACEYDSADAARAGQAEAAARFDAVVPGRRSFVNRKTLLSVAPPGGTAGDETGLIQTAFAAL
jgi:hypothetical protein